MKQRLTDKKAGEAPLKKITTFWRGRLDADEENIADDPSIL